MLWLERSPRCKYASLLLSASCRCASRKSSSRGQTLRLWGRWTIRITRFSHRTLWRSCSLWGLGWIVHHFVHSLEGWTSLRQAPSRTKPRSRWTLTNYRMKARLLPWSLSGWTLTMGTTIGHTGILSSLLMMACLSGSQPIALAMTKSK